ETESEVKFDGEEAKARTEGEVGDCVKCGGPVRAEMAKISKTKLNIVDPDEMMRRYGADTVRLYMLSDAPPDRMQVWSEAGINGAWRTINRLWHLVTESLPLLPPIGEPIPTQLNSKNRELRRKAHQCILRVTEAIEGGFQFNTAIARCNELVNQLKSFSGPMNPAVRREVLEILIRILSPIVPHFAEECWERLGHTTSIFAAGWPQADPLVAREEKVEISLQVNGKTRAVISVPAESTREDLEREALAHPDIQRWLQGKTVAKVIAVPGRTVNVVAR
ncbi:MAG: class I tRNA ligase family protein, partial [Planctomycetota bacterium]|nr:class I tRNA ligase family protein [Planctomycetota bacterium]